ncbi:hypothetical protein PAECIP111893_04655 [Paenibacillus plantiphilus]|uniref:Conjugal transfer protein TrbI n=1 Tax=Paenibacillus plantiphilus TaxID=2905650 RepID=A0ABN8GX56_9BACL|nr:hypothetical protein [Paenibacillus plantiphilus]CAH1220986.1 hypothetical protein PAECIP111893_04655 [Paenibacillus plantiphilus]
MRRQSVKMAVVGGAIAIVVLFGIDMATSGVERINGPIDQQQALPVDPLPSEDGLGLDPEREGLIREAEQMIERLKAEQAQASAEEQSENERLPGMPDLSEQSTVNKLADGTAGFLQSLSSRSIRFVVSIFDSVTD